MDTRSSKALREILRSAGVKKARLDETFDSVVDVFDSYRRHAAMREGQRRLFEQQLRDAETPPTTSAKP